MEAKTLSDLAYYSSYRRADAKVEILELDHLLERTAAETTQVEW